jgi:hypothetical protein
MSVVRVDGVSEMEFNLCYTFQVERIRIHRIILYYYIVHYVFRLILSLEIMIVLISLSVYCTHFVY